MAFLNSTRAVEALERIATALETLAGLAPRSELPGDPTGVSYLDDEKDFRAEVARELYRMRTGKELLPGELPPRPPGAEEADETWDNE